jgi:hypothetical protein
MCAATGCDTLTSAQSGVGQLADTAGQAKDQADKGKDETAKAKADKDKKKNGGGGAAAPAEDEDGDRLHAKDAPLNTPIDDKVDFSHGDRYDWRKVILGGKPGIATFELHWDEESANIDLDIYNKFGDPIGKSPPKLEGQQVKKILVQIDEPGVYYLRVSAPTKKDASIYTVAIKWKGPGGPPPVAATPAAPATPAAAGGSGGGAPAAPAAPLAFAADPSKLLGSIVQYHREGGTLVLYLDRGSQAKLREGMSGNILDGPEGDKLLDGGTFTISQVIDGNKSIAHSSYAKQPGKNKRIVVNLK